MYDRWNQNAGRGGCGCACGPDGCIVVEVPGIQGPQGEAGTGQRFCAALDAGQTEKLSALTPSDGARAGDIVLNSSGQLFQIVSVDDDTQSFTVGDLIGAIETAPIDDESTSEKTIWSSAKIAALLGQSVDFVKTFEAALKAETPQLP